MNAMTLVFFLMGRREAIEAFARSPHTLWIGAVFVLSAGFAREYDGVDLLAEPWHLGFPLLASFLAATLLFMLLSDSPAGGRSAWWEGWRSYHAFLGLFWLTAPLAWLYAVPYEQFLPPTIAARMNLLTLVVVAAWRVALILRVVGVLTNLSFSQMLGRTLSAIGIIVIIGAIGSLIVQKSLIDVMGGVRENNPWQMYNSPGAEVCVGFLAFLAVIPLAILGSLGPRPLYVWRLSTDTDGPPSFAGLWGLVALSLAVWLAVLPFTQPAQQRRTVVDRAIARGEYDRAAALLREWPEASFPLTWRPGPPSVNRMTALAALVAMIGMRKQDLPAWAANYYRERQWELLRSHGIYPFATEEHLRAFVEDPEIGAWLDAPLAPDASSSEQWNHERYREIRQRYTPPEHLPKNKEPAREPE